MNNTELKDFVVAVLAIDGMIGRDTALKLLNALEAAEGERDEFRESFNSNESEKQTLFHQKDMLLTANINIGKNLKQAERDRDEVNGALKASSDNAVTWMKRALKAESEIERRDAAAGQPVGLVIADVFGDGDRYLKVKPINTTGLFIGRDLLYTAASPAVLPPLKKITSSSPTDWHRGVVHGWNSCIEMALKLGAQTPKPVTIPGRYDIAEMSGNNWQSYRCIEPDEDGEYIRLDEILSSLSDAGVPYEVKP